MVGFTSSRIIVWDIPALQNTESQPEFRDFASNSVAIRPTFSIGYNDAESDLEAGKRALGTQAPRIYLPALWYQNLTSPFTFQIASHSNGEISLASTFKMEFPSKEHRASRDSLTLLSAQQCKLPLPHSRNKFAEVSFSSDFLVTSHSFYASPGGIAFLLIPRAFDTNPDWTTVSFTFPAGSKFLTASVCPCSGRVVCGMLGADPSYIYVFDLL
jgi:hypothetical protein